MTVAPTRRADGLESSVTGQNADRVTRMFARFISVGYLAYLVLLTPTIKVLEPSMDAWWTPAALVMVFGSGLLPGALSFHSDIQPTRRAAVAAAIAFMVAVALWPMAWNGPQVPEPYGVWLAAFPGLASLSATLGMSATLAFTHMVIGCVVLQVFNFIARASADAAMLSAEIPFSIMFCSLFVGGAVMALRTGRLLDATTADAHAAAAHAAAESARAVERERFDALTHDSVMATLLAAARAQPRERVRSLAAATLAELDDIRSDSGDDESFSLDRATTHLRTSVSAADEHCRFLVVHTGDPGPIPAEGVRVLGSALAEAVRNSRLHAGPGAERTVTMTVTDDGVVVVAEDDGVGFDPTSVASHRLGVTVSILGRMSRLPGGSASIDTRPGAGTRVRLEWRRP